MQTKAKSSASRGGLPGLAVRRPITVLMSLAALLVVGFVADRQLPVQLLPQGFSPPFMWVSVPTLPAAPADNERLVAEPIEEAISTLPRLESLKSFIRSTEVDFRVALHAEADVDEAYAQLRDRLDRTLPKLPDGVRQAFVWRHNPNDDPIYILGVSYPPEIENPDRMLREHLLQPLERLPGVSRVRLRGVKAHAIRITISAEKARLHGVDAGALVQRLRRDNFTLAIGTVEDAGTRVLIRALSRFQDLDELRRWPVTEGVTLADLAEVNIGPDPEPIIHRIDGAPAATLMVYKEATANTIETSARVTAALAEHLAEDDALAGFETQPFFDQGRYISQSIEQLRRSALYGGLIAVTILFLFLRSVGMTLLVTLAIPLCLMITIIVLYFLGDSLNVMSMMGLMLSVGMVVDNAIVVLENIDRIRRGGATRPAAAVAGAREVSLAVVLATLTTMVVFLPMILLGDQPMVAFYLGKIGFPVCYALLGSLFVALIYIPCGAARLKGLEVRPLGPVLRGLQGFYTSVLRWVLAHRLPAALCILGLLVSTQIPLGSIKRVDQVEAGLDAVRIHMWGPPNGSHAELDATAKALEKQLLVRKSEIDVRAVLARRGWSPEHVIMQVFFVDLADRTVERDDAIAQIREMLPKRPGYRSRVGWRGGGGGEGGLQMRVRGPDTTVATEIAERVAAQLKLIEGVTDASLEEPEGGVELRVLVERERAGRAALTPMVIGGSVDYSLRGRRLSDFHGRDHDLEMWVEVDRAEREDLSQLLQLPVQPRASRTTTGAPRSPVPLATVAQLRRTPGYAKITRRDRQTTVTIMLTGDENELFDRLRTAAAGLTLPRGYSVAFGDRFDRQRKNEEGGSFAVLVAIALVFFLMGVLFESVILPFSILLSIPLAFCGVFWTLHLTNTPLDIMAIVGCIILVGIVVNNGIVLVDQVQHLRESGLERTEALIGAARNRVRPILMTALTTIGGLIPMALGHASLLGIEYAPLGRVVVGGLVTGTVLTLVAVPWMYSLLDDLRQLPRRLGAGRLGARRLAADIDPEQLLAEK